MSANNYLITVFWHEINDTTFPMTRHSDKMTRDSRHGIIYFWKFSKKSFNQWVCGQGIKILKNPYMGTSRDLIRRCLCGMTFFFENYYPNSKVEGFCIKKLSLEFLIFLRHNNFFLKMKTFFRHKAKLLVHHILWMFVKFWNL